ncbi:transglycosylase SLT domain-containing protein [candidate division FCPU426 bacterium]|nr:transglycosylase SLT domain-containing protein [candidate division FCPU426 bacterium]
MFLLRIMMVLLICLGTNGCAHLAGVQKVQAGDGVPLTAAFLDSAEQELDLALKSYSEEDWAGAEQAVIRAARILYAAESPMNGEGKRYAGISSKLSLLTVRLNRLLHGTSPELEPEKFSMPIPHNARIEKWIDYYLTRGREEFSRWLRRSGRYTPLLQALFVQEGLPLDLVYLALVESGFNPRNRSPKHAVGMFQFIKGTAELVGLKEDHWLDERRHPEKAALGAIRHIKSLYKEFDDWDLALAAYNAGSGRVAQAIRAQGSRDYWQLALPPETEMYVPKFYATLIIAREPELYGFNPDFETVENTEEVEVPGGVDFSVIAEAAGVTVSVVKDLNTELTKNCTPPGPETYLLRLPAGSGEVFKTAFADIPDENKYLNPEELARRKMEGVYVVYTVKTGDSLYTIAKKHNTTVSKIQRWNPIIRESKYIFPGNKLRIYRTQ